jgi:hypothetical protein
MAVGADDGVDAASVQRLRGGVIGGLRDAMILLAPMHQRDQRRTRLHAAQRLQISRALDHRIAAVVARPDEIDGDETEAADIDGLHVLQRRDARAFEDRHAFAQTGRPEVVTVIVGETRGPDVERLEHRHRKAGVRHVQIGAHAVGRFVEQHSFQVDDQRRSCGDGAHLRRHLSGDLRIGERPGEPSADEGIAAEIDGLLVVVPELGAVLDLAGIDRHDVAGGRRPDRAVLG